jgi:hypothetical protein
MGYLLIFSLNRPFTQFLTIFQAIKPLTPPFLTSIAKYGAIITIGLRPTKVNI